MVREKGGSDGGGGGVEGWVGVRGGGGKRKNIKGYVLTAT